MICLMSVIACVALIMMDKKWDHEVDNQNISITNIRPESNGTFGEVMKNAKGLGHVLKI